MTGTYLSFFLTTFVGLTNVQLGTMNTVKGLIGLWGSFVIGVIMQKVRLPWGRYRSWIYIMMPLAGIFQILTFVNWGNLPEGIKFPLVFVICVLDTFLYNFAFAAYTGLMIPLAPDPTERTGLAGARSQINSIGKVFFGFVAVAAIAFIGKLFNNEAAGYTGFMVLIVIALTASFFNLAKIAKSVDPSTGKSDPAAKDGTAVETVKESKKDGVSFWTMIKSVCNKQTIAWLIVSFSHGIPYALVMSLVAYYYGFVIGDKTMMATYMALSTLMQFVGSFIGSPQMNFFDVELRKENGGVYAVFGDNKIKVPAEKLAKFKDESYIGKQVVMGIRPENLDDAPEYVAEHADAKFKVHVEVTELMGSETYLYLSTSGKEENVIARVDPRTATRNGDNIEVAMDTSRLHFFDKETEETILNR